MKVAICMSGLARTFAKCYNSYLDNIINEYDCDVFIYVSKDSNSDAMGLINSVNSVILEKDPILDEKDYVKYKKRHRGYTVQGILQQYWKIKMCNDLMMDYQIEKNIKYDWVIRCRPDLMITRKIDDLNKLDKNKIHIPRYLEVNKEINERIYPLGDWKYSTDCLPDRFAIASPELMSIYAKRWDELHDTVKRIGFLFAENCMCQYLKYNNVSINILKEMYYIKR